MLAQIRASSADRVLISSEFFSDGEPDGIRRVIDELDRERVQVVVTLRPLARILPSQWQQWIQNRWVTPFDEWLHSLFEAPEKNDLFWRRHAHDELVARWASIVGPDRVTVVALDDRDRTMVLRVFEQLTGLAPGTLAVDDDLSNRSMTVPEVETIRAFNLLYREEKLSIPLYTRLMRFGAAPYMRRRRPHADEARIELPAWAIPLVEARSRQIVEGIAASGVRVVGSLDTLTAVPAPTPGAGEPSNGATQPVMVHPDAAAAAMLGLVLASGLARGTAPITTAEREGLAPDRPLPRAPRPTQEPEELLRVSTLQLCIVILRRTRASVIDRVSGLFRRRRR
jgi:hypothetical protein